MDKEQFILGVDLDGVLADYFSAIRPIASEWLGVKEETLSIQTDYNFNMWGVNASPKGYPALHKFAVTQRNLFVNMRPMKNAAQVLRRIDEYNIRIRIITNRLCVKGTHKEAITQTVEWLDKYGIPYWDICFVKDKTTVKADLYVEDSPNNLKSMRDQNLQYLIFRNYANKDVKGPSVNNWLQVEEKVMDICTKRVGLT